MFKVSLCDRKYYSTVGTPLIQIGLYDLLRLCYENLPKDGEKGRHGQVFPYINNRLGRDYWPDNTIFNDYVGFADIDHITKKCADIIFNSFEELCKGFPYLIAINYSSSYFLRDNDVGLHIFINTGELNDREYFYWMRYLYGMLALRIKKVCGIDLRINQIKNKDGEYENIIDWHNCYITQRINLFYSPFKWNNDNIIFDPNEIEGLSEIKKKIEEEYRKELLFKDENKTEEYTESVNLDNIVITNRDNIDKVKVDRHLHIGCFSGNDIRWRICSISKELFGNDAQAKEWCDRYFYYDNGKSIYSTGKSYGTHQLVLNWLIENGYLTNKEEELYHSAEGYEVNTYLSNEYKDLILNKINEHKCFTTRGDTGIGKTVCFSLVNKEVNGIMLVPYLNMRKLYEENGIKIIERENQDKYDGNDACVMVYDRYTLLKDEQVFGKTVFIDESHVLFTDRQFRKRLIEVIEKIKRCAGKIVIISATPLDESKLLGSEEEIVFTKARKYVDMYWKDVRNINECKLLVDRIIEKNIKDSEYDLICLFSNRCVRYVYDNLLIRYGRSVHNIVNVFHRDYEDLGDIDRVMNSEILDKKINIGTSLIYNGLNFNNIENNILVIIQWEKYSTSAADIIQCVGRFRKCGVKVLVIAVDKEAEDYETNKMNSEILSKLNLDHKLFSYNEDYVKIADIVDELYEFRLSECTKEKVIEKLNAIGYIRITELENNMPEYIGVRKNMLKQKIDGIIKKEMNGIKLSRYENEIKKDGMKYYKKYMGTINNFLWKYSLDKKDLLELNSSQMIESDNNNKYYSLNDTIDYLNKIIVSSLDDENYWDNVEEELIKNWESINNEKLIKKQGHELQEAKKLNKKYGKYFHDYELDSVMENNCVNTLVADLITENKNACAEKSRKRSNASKKKAVHVIITDNMPGWMINKYKLSYNKIFDSSSDLAAYCHVKKSLVSYWFKLLYVSKIEHKFELSKT